jgi:hypothetical protein
MGECNTADGNRLELTRASAIELPGLLLAGGPAPDGKAYIFTLNARKGARRATTTTTVAVVVAPLEAVGQPPSASIFPFASGKVNAGDVARIQAAVSSDASPETLRLTWSATRVTIAATTDWLDGAELAPADQSETSAVVVEQPVDLLADNFISSASISTLNLVLSANALQSGWRYKLRLDVVDTNGAAAAFITLQQNQPPAGGSVLAFPATGTAMSTRFRLVAESWTDADPPLAYRFTVKVRGQEDQQLQDFSPLAEYRGTLPGGASSQGGVLVVAVEVMDALGALSQPQELEVVSTWPVIASEEEATAATASLLSNAEAAIMAGGPQEALSLVSGACQQLAVFKQNQQGRRLLSSNGCVGGGGVSATGAAAERANQRESMINVTRSALGAVPVSTTLIGGVANTAAQVLSDPCEATAWAREAGVTLVAGLIATAGRADNDVLISAEGSATLLAALSAAVTPAQDDDDNAAVARTAATAAARAMITTQLGPVLPGETPSSVNATLMSYVAARVESPGSAGMANATGGVGASASAGGATFAVPTEALALSGDRPVDQLLLVLAYDAHVGGARGRFLSRTSSSSANASAPTSASSPSALSILGISNGNGTGAAGNDAYGNGIADNSTAGDDADEAEDIASAPRVGGTVSLVLRAPGGDELTVRNLTVPIEFSLALNDAGEALRSPACYIEDAAQRVSVPSGVNATPPTERVVCSFFDEETVAYSTVGCATLPNPFPPGSELQWTPEVRDGRARLVSADDSFLWTFQHPTLLLNCTRNETLSADNATRLRVYDGAGCAVEDPMNPTRCFWRRSTQSFEGCGCAVGPTAQCLCNHATDFSASSSPPKIKPISIEELLSISLDDVFNTWKVFAVVGGMFGATAVLACLFEARDRRAKRRLLNKFIDPARGATRLGFAIVQDIWTWHIDVQEMQFMFNNLHHPNTQVEVNKVIAEQIGTDDEKAVSQRLEEILAQSSDYAAPEITRAVERRRAALRRAARAREGLPQVSNGLEGVAPEEVARIEAAIEHNVSTADVGITVRTEENGKTYYESELTGDSLKIEELRRMGFKEEDASDSSDSGGENEEEEEEGRTKEKMQEDEGEADCGVEGKDQGEARRTSAPSTTHASPSLASRIVATYFSSLPFMRKKGSGPLKASQTKTTRGGFSFVVPPKRKHVAGLPVVKRNGPAFCGACGINYVRFIIAFPIESLKRNLVMWKAVSDSKGVHLPFDRAVGTAMVYAFLDVKNVVGHIEMASRIYDAAQLPWLMPTGITFPLLVAEFKAMLSGNLTASGWMKRSNLWNIVALQNQEGSWVATDSLAGALRASGELEVRPPIPSVGDRAVIKSYYDADTLLRCCPPALMACSSRLGWITVDSIWCTLLAIEGCNQNGLKWVLNPWDDIFNEFDILQCGWTYVEQQVKSDPVLAAAVVDAEKHAERHVTAWRDGFKNTVQSLHDLRVREAKDKAAAARAAQPPLAARAWRAAPKTVGGVAGEMTWLVRWLYSTVAWWVKMYMAAHMFFRAFLANPTDSFSGAERIVMQSTLYLVGLLVATWFYYIRSIECCVVLRQEVAQP